MSGVILRRTLLGGVLTAASLVPLVAVAQQFATGGPDCGPRPLEILVERSFAAARGLQPGSELRVGASPERPFCPARIVGIFEPAADPSTLTIERPQVVLHLPELQALTGRRDEVDQFTLSLRAGADAGAVASEVERLLPGSTALPIAAVVESTSTTFEIVRRFHGAIGLVTLVAGGVFLTCIMVLKVQERRRPFAALRLIGVSRRTLFAWLVLEAALLAALGAALGLALGEAVSALVNGFYQRSYDTTLIFSNVTPDIRIRAIVIAVVLGLLAGILATSRLFRTSELDEVGR